MRRTIALLAACLGMAACTPAEIVAFGHHDGEYVTRAGQRYPTHGEIQHTWSCVTPAGQPYTFHGYIEGLPPYADCDRVVA